MKYGIDLLQKIGVNICNAEVWLDGVKQDATNGGGCVIAFDPVEGYIERYVRVDGPGSRIKIKADQFVVETVYGKVEAYAVRGPKNRWSHAIPEPDGDRVLIQSIRW